MQEDEEVYPASPIVRLGVFVLAVALIGAYAFLSIYSSEEPKYPLTCRNCGIHSEVVVTTSDTQSSFACPVCMHEFYFRNQVP